MNITRIQTIIDKEWAEIFKNRIVLFTVGFLPLLFTILPLIILYSTRAVTDEAADLPPQFLAQCGTMELVDCFQTFILNQFMLLFMMMPLIIPVAIASYSIVGEKTTRSLEPLLATPITTEELLTAKSLSAAVPAIVATWAAFILFVLAAPIVGGRPAVVAHILSPVWLIAIFAIGPLLAILAVNFAILISSRVNDPRVAEQVSAVIIVPILGLVFGQLAGVIILSIPLMLGTVAVMLILDAGLIYLGARLFQREVILTRWK